MKTSIKIQSVKAFIAILLASIIFPLATFALEVKPKKLHTITNVKKISIKGNVQVILVQRLSEGITYTDDNYGTAIVSQEGALLRITGKTQEVSKLFVYVNDIFRIEADGNAVVKTEGKLNTKFLQIFLKGNAQADINTNTQGLYTVIEGNTNLKLTGYTDNHTLQMGKEQKLTAYDFVALNTNVIPTEVLAINK
ncbi:GIN domain-containing protein [Pedobacter nototheniae]|uniref:GIN domain-containing protein n=1 Tax=Pedobacter nototheniae TaxID=2488994 RepID=UPI00103DDE5A|nr:DUF2807 domain-containing protein [Pedobacter nototheniae]